MKKFYKTVTVQACDAGWQVLLDEKPIRTPQKRLLALPTSALAELVRAEWDAVQETIDPKAMPHTGLAHAALDALQTERAHVVDELSHFGDTDLLYYRSPEPALAEKQKQLWNPVLDWAREHYRCQFALAEGVMPVAQDPAMLAALRADIEALHDWQLAPFTIWVHKLGSLLLALAVRHGRLSASEAATLAELDEAHQASMWGNDADTEARLRAVAQEIADAQAFFLVSVD